MDLKVADYVKNLILNKCILYIKKNANYSETKIKEIRYGLEGIYLSITKLIIISIISLFLGIFKEMIIYLLIFNILRSQSFGLHATKSWICLLSSTIIFIGIPYLCLFINIPINIKVVICIVGLIFMYKNSPADTHKKPIVSKKRRQRYKFASVILTIIYAFIALLIQNNFLANCFMFSIILQNFMISHTTYKIFKLPYNNYIYFLKTHPEFME